MTREKTPLGQLSIRNVTKIYDPDGAGVLAVDNCSMEIAAGDFCVLVGPSG
jgi:NitT/TauT family transport system ATP-binding protein